MTNSGIVLPDTASEKPSKIQIEETRKASLPGGGTALQDSVAVEELRRQNTSNGAST